jgi:hypothetical protein
MSFRRPSNSASPAARRWIAIEPLFPTPGKGVGGFKAARGFPLLLCYAAQVVLLERRATSTNPIEPGDMEQEE